MNPYSIAVANRQRALPINRRRLIRLVRSVLAREEVAEADISVAIVDDPQIHALNRQFLNHDFPTDVISFLLECRVTSGELSAVAQPLKGTGARFAANRRRSTVPRRTQRRGVGKVLGGEIVISAETARRSAADYDARPEDELALYLVHGLLHLCGYDDRTPREKRLMRRREAEALQNWNTAAARRELGQRRKDRQPRIPRIGTKKTTKKITEKNRG
jgi:probable rRNA maturation factor